METSSCDSGCALLPHNLLIQPVDSMWDMGWDKRSRLLRGERLLPL